MAEFGSSTDLETLQRSGRGKVVVLGVVIAGALGAAAYAFLHKGGTGNPEEAGKVLVVTRGNWVGSSIALRDAGFETGEGTLQAWVDKAKDEVPDLDVDGLPAVMALADRFGWGYVLFEAPGQVDFSALEFEGGPPTIPEDAKWAAVSVGDFAFPHVITFNPKPSEVLRDGSLPMLQALFEQEKLKALRDPESLAVDQLQLREKLEEALRKLDQVPDAERLAQKVVADLDAQLVEGERAEPKPGRIGAPLESLTAQPIADGSVLSIGREVSVVTRDAIRVDLELGKSEQFLFAPPMAEHGARTSCASLAGGAVPVGDWRGVEWSDDASTVVLSTHAGGEELWVLDTAQPGKCAWTSKGKLERGRRGLDGAPVAGRAGRIARAGFVDGLGVVSVMVPGEPEAELGMLESTVFTRVEWLDDEHILALIDYQTDGTSWIALLSARDTSRVAVMPVSVADGAGGIVAIAAIPGTQAFVASTQDGRLVRVELPAKPADVLANPPLAPEQTPLVAEGRPTVYQLDPAKLTAKTLADPDGIEDLEVSRDGRFAAMTVSGPVIDADEPYDREIAVVDLSSGALTVLTRNALRDSDPHFTSDGAHVVFATAVDMPRSDWRLTVARILPTPGH